MMNDPDVAIARVRGSSSVADLLDAAFDGFEVIRQVARACEDRVPELFAAFITAACTAVEGRNALNDAPSLPLSRTGPPLAVSVAPAGDVDHIAGQLADLAAVLDRHLRQAAVGAETPGDRAACLHAAKAATQIHWLLAGDADETRTR
jgi:hypothetical protein